MKKIFSAIRNHKIIFAIVAIILVGGGYYIFKINSKSTTTTTYTYGTVTLGTVMQTVSGTGQIQASKQTSITPEVSGTIISVAVDAGQKIKAGQVIAKIDSSDAQGTLEERKNSFI